MSSLPRWRAGGRFVLRAPVLSYKVLDPYGGDVALQRENLSSLTDLPHISEAIRVASPSLHGGLPIWRAAPDSGRGQHIERALVKYIARMATRPTPFGLFAGVAVGEVSANFGRERFLVGEARMHRRLSRVDNEILFELATCLTRLPDTRQLLTFRPNTSLTFVAGVFRYVEACTLDERDDRGRTLEYHLVSVQPTPYLLSTIERSRGGARLSTLATALVADDPSATLEEAHAYMDQLVETQLLVPDLGIVVTGTEPIDALIAQLAAAGARSQAASLDSIREQVAAIDREGLGVEPGIYDRLRESLEHLLASSRAPHSKERHGELNRGRVIQVDLALSMREPATLGQDVVREVAGAVDVLRRIGPRHENPSLVDFRREFRERWDERQVPLAEALDEEAGIAFGPATQAGTEESPLLASLPFAHKEKRMRSWGRRDAYLLALVNRAMMERGHEIVLAEDDLRALATAVGDDGVARLPDAMSIMVRLGRRNDQPEIRIESISGPSGARLLGRFAHLNPDVDAMVREHVAREAAQQPEVIFAEVVHLPQGRTANILCRPVVRDYEIVYLGLGGAEPGRQIRLDDLLVSVRGERVVLRSRRLGLEVLPRLTSAHNVSAHELGVYRFLTALQSQGTDPVGWSWGPLADCSWLPRVRFGRAVLAPEQWLLDERDLRELAVTWRASAKGERRDRVFTAMQSLRTRRGLPRFLVLVDGDREQFVDLDHQLLVHALVGELVVRRSARLAEVFPEPDAWAVEGPDGRHACEVILTFVRGPDTVAADDRRVALRLHREAPRVAAHGPFERRFPPGSRWLYARVYGGASSADRVLCQAVGPLVRKWTAVGAIDKWFFVRYAEPTPHLRVRFHGDPMRLSSEVLPALERATAPLLTEGSLWRVDLGTYEREVERYGGPRGIELCEELFWHDSEAALQILEGLDAENKADMRWQVALCSVDRLLSALGLSADLRTSLLARARLGLVSGHHARTALCKAIGARYRSLQARLDYLLGGDSPLAPDAEPTDPVLRAVPKLLLRDSRIGPVLSQLRSLSETGSLDVDLHELSLSLIHMSCNRLLHSSQRAQELVLYDLLRRHYARRRALAQSAIQLRATELRELNR